MTMTNRRARGRWKRCAFGIPVITITVIAFSAESALANRYGIAVFKGANHHGTQISVETSSMNVPNTKTDAIANDNWVINTNTNPITFIEAGIAKGNVSFMQCKLTLSRSSFFWADFRPNGTYYCHSGAVATFGTSYDDRIHYEGNANWTVDIGTLTGTSRSSLTSENEDNAGLEETTSAGTSCGHSTNLSWFDGVGNLHSGWTDEEFGDATISQNKPPYASWTNQPHALKAYSNDSSC